MTRVGWCGVVWLCGLVRTARRRFVCPEPESGQDSGQFRGMAEKKHEWATGTSSVVCE